MLGRRIAARPRPPATVRDLEIALLEEWNSIPQSLIDNLIASMANSSVEPDHQHCDGALLRLLLKPTWEIFGARMENLSNQERRTRLCRLGMCLYWSFSIRDGF
ncbi:hypothetical protein TNCV_3519801 [Trichonephila clavipes]|nr:hypothetical protein TNCV_3519801 [Trichonephila clavipes]